MAYTIDSLLRAMFPRGTRPKTRAEPNWSAIPIWAPDLFAFCATLVEQSGAYRHVSPSPIDHADDPFGLVEFVKHQDFHNLAAALSWGMAMFPDQASRSSTLWEQQKAYVNNNLPKLDAQNSIRHDATHTQKYIAPEVIIEQDLSVFDQLWKTIVANPNTKITDDVELKAKANSWQSAALKLMVVSDQACSGIGFFPRGSAAPNWLQGMLLEVLKVTAQADINRPEVDTDNLWFSSFTSDKLKGFKGVNGAELNIFDQDICCVLPKTRTSTIGCTLRSLTHNLALLPPSHLIEARWRMSPFRPINAFHREGSDEHVSDLNLLLIPFPYQIALSAFNAKGHEKYDKWGYYDVNQTWLKPDSADIREFTNFVLLMVKKAKDSVGNIHGVVFPELSINGEYLEKIANELRDSIKNDNPEFEFIISGLKDQRPDYSQEEGKKTGNFVSIIGAHRQAKDGKHFRASNVGNGTQQKISWTFRGSREKHHRWKLNGNQTKRYGLSSVLNSDFSWWEGIMLSKRVIEFYEVRAGTSMTVLICEDLARADPCQTVLRAVGPNLVIALLMDGPQRAFRWPGHYAGVLADDPGSSVLTLTSLGLIDRASATDSSASRAVAFFKDCRGNERELNLPHGSHALAISLRASAKEEHTLDLRSDGNAAYIWELREVCPIRLRANQIPDWVAGA